MATSACVEDRDYLGDGRLAGITAIAAVATFSPTELLYPIHHTFANVFVLGTITRGRRTQTV